MGCENSLQLMDAIAKICPICSMFFRQLEVFIPQLNRHIEKILYILVHCYF